MNRLHTLLAAAGLGSAAYWGWSETRGDGGLRPYLLMRLYPMLLIPFLLRFYPQRYSGDRAFLGQPRRWLRAIHHHRAIASAAPKPWDEHYYPRAMQHLPTLVRAKAIEIANALLAEGHDEGSAIRIAIAGPDTGERFKGTAINSKS